MTMTTTSGAPSSGVSIVCSASDAVALNAWKALVSLLQLSNVTFATTTTDSTTSSSSSSSSSASVALTVIHPWTKAVTTTTTVGWLEGTKLLCRQVPSFHLFGTTVQEEALVEAWITDAIESLLSSKTNTKEEHEASISAFVVKLEEWLFGKEWMFLLTQDYPTAADVCLAVWLAQSANFATTAMPQECMRWSKHVLTNIDPSFITTTTTSTDLPQVDQLQISDTTTTTTTTTTTAVDLGPNAVLDKLNEFQIPYSVYTHEVCMTAEDLVAKVPLPSTTSHTHTKNLFFKDKKHGLLLLTVLPTAHVNTKELGSAVLNLSGKVNFRMADASILMDTLSCAPGTVGPLAICQDKEETDASKKVTMVLDAGLLKYEHIHSHPLRNDASVVLTPADLQAFLAKTGHDVILFDFPTAGTSPPAAATDQKNKKKPTPAAAADGAAATKKPEKEKNKDKKVVEKGATLLALQWKKEENFSMWYSDAITLSEMIAYYDISGCYILRPWSYKMWELIQEWFNVEIRALDVENCYFPLFVTQDRLEKEKDHVEGFAPEVAWVTKSGDGDLAKPIAIRPTSETIMYPAFSDWIKSHRDLPLKLNQWSNVVRWEFKYPTPFLRSREFLWQEGHTAHVSHDDADVMVRQALELYRRVYEDLLAVPVIPGYKTEEEKFAGGLQTTTVEAYVPVAGRAIQGATSHNLGQNFGKMFDITYQDTEGKTETAWQTSWGLTTRTIGVMVMVHGDNTGLVLPPRIAPLQCVIVPIISKKLSMEDVSVYCQDILTDLLHSGIRAKFDDRTMYNPGWKYNHWEQKGVPIRIEVGPRDMETKQARIVVRYSGEKYDMPIEGMGLELVSKLQDIQNGLFAKAKAYRDDHLVYVTDWKDFVPELEKHNLVMTPWCGGEHKDWEEWVKNKSREESLASRGEEVEDARTATSVAAKTLCIPFHQPDLPAGTKCFASGLDATCWVLWGRSY